MRWLVLATILLCAPPLVCYAQEPQSVVDRFYPEGLASSRPQDRHSCFLVLRLTSIGEPDAIAAGYTDASKAVLRLLTRVAPDIYVVSYEAPVSMDMKDGTCRMSGRDVDGNGQPDVVLQLSSGSESSQLLFKWTGDTLIPLPLVR